MVMITNAVCTVVRRDNDGEYFIVGNYPCMWQGSYSVSAEKNGAENANEITVYIPDISADVRTEDYISPHEISGEIDTSEMFSVMSVKPRNYGSSEMRHIKLEVR